MANYKKIHGVNLQKLASNPSIGTTPGDIWYNTTLGEFKVIRGLATGVWATGGNLTNARIGVTGAGTQTAGLAFGGHNPGDPGNEWSGAGGSATEEYDGTSWTNKLTYPLNQRRNLASCGTQTAAIGFGGFTPYFTTTSVTEEYDGSAWTAGGNLGTSRYNLAGAGTQTAGLAFGGTVSFPTSINATEEYDGTSWTAGGNIVTTRGELSGCGTQTAGLGFGGYDTAVTAATEEYDGSAWTAGGNLATAKMVGAGAGTQTAGTYFGGANSQYGGPEIMISTNNTENYDGLVWTIGGNMSTPRRYLAGAGTQSAGLGFGGADYGYNSQDATEEYVGPGLYTETITST